MKEVPATTGSTTRITLSNGERGREREGAGKISRSEVAEMSGSRPRDLAFRSPRAARVEKRKRLGSSLRASQACPPSGTKTLVAKNLGLLQRCARRGSVG